MKYIPQKHREFFTAVELYYKKSLSESSDTEIQNYKMRIKNMISQKSMIKLIIVPFTDPAPTFSNISTIPLN